MVTKENKEKYNLLIGRHCLVKAPNFLLGAVQEALTYEANSLMVYSGAPQNSARRPLSDWKIPEFKKLLVKNNLDINNVVVHGPYLVNLANTINEKIFPWSVKFLKGEVARMSEIGFKTMVIHPGSTLNAEKNKSLLQIAKGINEIFEENTTMCIALETTCGRGGETGSKFEELKKIIDNVKQKERVGVCWDTCHLYAAGYDIKDNLEKVIKEFSEIIGLDKLWVIHLNDSDGGLGLKTDLHKNIGQGKIGLKALKKIVWHPKFNGIIKILETPRNDEKVYREEIKLLKSLD